MKTWRLLIMNELIEYFNGDELAANVWKTKYALTDKEGNMIEKTPYDMHKRLATEFHRIENNYKNPLTYEQIFNLLDGFKYFIPAGSPSFGIGNKYSYSSLGNCFVIGNTSDSYGGIMKSDQELVQLMKRRAGVGLDLSHIRPSKAKVSNAAKTSSGIISFMERYSNSTREVSQEGRRGALMLSLDISHPDILKYIRSKTDLTKITGANISVKITDKFMFAVQEDSYHILEFPGTIATKVKARDIWNSLMHQAHKTAEPGVLFWDRILTESPADCYEYFKTISTNPCGEIPLSKYDSCRLGAMNIYSFVENPFKKDSRFNWVLFEKYVKRSQKLMDDLVDLELEKINLILAKLKKDPEPITIRQTEIDLWLKIRNALVLGRRTGLGQLGLADAGASLGLYYGSLQFNSFAEKVAKTLAVASYEASIQMAEERGAFPEWVLVKEHKNPFINRVLNANLCMISQYRKTGRRNISNLTVAPTGSTSMLPQVSNGIEPVFLTDYTRRRKVNKDHPNITFVDDKGDCWEEYKVVHPKYKVWQEEGEKSNPYENATADKIDPIQKVIMQGRIQKWVDHSISITHNLPKNISLEEVSKIYMKAWEVGCKGCTVYREGSRSGVLVRNEPNIKKNNASKRLPKLDTDIFFPTIKGDQYIVLVGVVDNQPYEVFCFIKNGIDLPKTLKTGTLHRIKSGHYNLLDDSNNVVVEDVTNHFKAPIEEFATRLISTSLRHGVDIKYIVEQLNKSEGLIQDFNKVIARVLKKYIKDEDRKGTCPKCDSEQLRYTEGCIMCKQCGFSKC